MPILAGSQHTTINNGHFIDQSAEVINNISLANGSTGIDILLEASNRDAAHDSGARDYAPRCHPGTREQHIEDIVYWAIPAAGTDNPLPLFWMKGPAGVGKSAIAQTCAERLKKLGKLGATFFFSVKERDKATEFIPTIAYQLSTEFPEYRGLVDKRILHDKAILNKTMATQLQTLIVEPLQELEKAGKGIGQRIVILVDGLDECESTDAQCRIIEIIAAAARDGVTPLCWAFFSRPEPHIEASFSSADIAQITCMTLLPISGDANSDIELYLRSGFENILRRRNIPLKSQWPSDNNIQTLVKNSNGLFIYAATALRVVAQPGSIEEALSAVCAASSDRTSNSPFAELDAFYMLIIQRIPPEELPTILLLCAILCQLGMYAPGGSQIGGMLLGNLLSLSEIQFRAVCNQLSAVLHFDNRGDSFDPIQFGNIDHLFQRATSTPTRGFRAYVRSGLGGSIYFYHKSFYDFLVDPMRSGTFCVMSLAVTNAQFKKYLELLLKYESDYFQGPGEVQASFQSLAHILNTMNQELVLAPGIPDSTPPLSWPCSNELVNFVLKACVYDWVSNGCLFLVCYPGIEPQLMRHFGQVDFRKIQEGAIMLFSGNSTPLSSWSWNYHGDSKFIDKTRLFRILPNEFQTFDVVEFNAMIKKFQKYEIIQPYYPNFISRFKSLIPGGFQDKRTSGLYRIGHGPKSCFWYWEINFKAGCYQDFRAPNLAEGRRIYEEERFDLWDKEDA
ncbi:hypothetical protein P691DRAFT_776618 [Macrolepiota fuliginosa MF-IS2]|uniref:Nephrocystin 3-like N-terminal domain-containing protein n=1 Tax=Macrolepiota fuliginosa MF-IS2 TaxID=1400762 RepID=A0A9P5X8I0_9AGAR|nr:hypothetical protein P691DRAFT_776618 [Macrolepiota fuliginosa MF-IS2]